MAASDEQHQITDVLIKASMITDTSSNGSSGTDANETGKSQKRKLGLNEHLNQKHARFETTGSSSSSVTSSIKSNEKPYECGMCGYASYEKSDVTKHMEDHTVEEQIKSDDVDEIAVNEIQFDEQSNPNPAIGDTSHDEGINLLDENNFDPSITGTASHEKDDSADHNIATKKPLDDSSVGDKHPDKGNLVNPGMSTDEKKPFECGVCGYASYQNEEVTQHMLTHTEEEAFHDMLSVSGDDDNTDNKTPSANIVKLFQCDYCGYTCARKYDLEKHERTHTGEKPYVCLICGCACARTDSLTTHMRKHTGEKPYKCDACSFACRKRVDLLSHVSIHTGERPFECDLCGYLFARKDSLNRHKKLHDDYKPYECPICGYVCVIKSSLTKHMKTHTGEKPHVCNVCGYSCVRKDSLNKHMTTHSKEKPHKCDVCGFATARKDSLSKHKKMHNKTKSS